MTFAFKKATRAKTKARIAMAGPSGSGKTRWALEVARVLGKRIAVIDTENDSASLYAGLGGLEFDSINLDNFAIENYIDCIHLAEREKYDVLVVDSLSHAWAGEGGALETVDRLKGNNAFTNGWGTVTPLQNKLTNAITQCKMHIICTLQSHQEYVLEEQRNRKGDLVKVPVRKGMAPVQRKGMEYLFTVYGEIELENHSFKVTKSRIDSIKQSAVSTNVLNHFAETIRDFHESGALPSAAPTDEAPKLPKPAAVGQQQPAGPQQLPTHTSKNYHIKQLANVPFTALTYEQLNSYVEEYRDKLRDPSLQSNHRQGVINTMNAAAAEMRKREAAGTHETDEGIPYAGDTGEVLTDDVSAKSDGGHLEHASSSARGQSSVDREATTGKADEGAEARPGRSPAVVAPTFNRNFSDKKWAGKSADKAPSSIVAKYIGELELAISTLGDSAKDKLSRKAMTKDLEDFAAFYEQLMAEEALGGSSDEDAAQ